MDEIFEIEEIIDEVRDHKTNFSHVDENELTVKNRNAFSVHIKNNVENVLVTKDNIESPTDVGDNIEKSLEIVNHNEDNREIRYSNENFTKVKVMNEDSSQSYSSGSCFVYSDSTQVFAPCSLEGMIPPSTPDISRSFRYKKPPFSYSQLVVLAIENSKPKALELRDIYSWIEKFFPYYESSLERGPGWKGSIRHELSQKKYYKKSRTKYSKRGGAWSVEKVYRPKLYKKFQAFLRDGETLNNCLNQSIPQGDLFTFINEYTEEESVATIIMENQNGDEVEESTKKGKRKRNASCKQKNDWTEVKVDVDLMKELYWPQIYTEDESSPPVVQNSTCIPRADAKSKNAASASVGKPKKILTVGTDGKINSRHYNRHRWKISVNNSPPPSLNIINESTTSDVNLTSVRLTDVYIKLADEELQRAEEEKKLMQLMIIQQEEWRQLRVMHERELDELKKNEVSVDK